MSERDVARLLAAREQGTCEVQTPVGFIDVLTATTVYEVKEARAWKAALGQVLAYARYYPRHAPALYLYGAATGKQKAIILEHCRALNVRVVWHRELSPEEALFQATPAREPAPDGLSLLISVRDKRYQITSTCTAWITLLAAPLPQVALQTYLDEAYTVFDSLLDNDLTLALRYRHQGEQRSLQRQRPDTGDSNRSPVCYRLNMTIRTASTIPMQLSLPAIRQTLPSGKRIERFDYARSTHIPELAALFGLILRDDFRWMNKLGSPATSIAKAVWRSYGMKKTRTGWKMGG